MPRAKRKTLGGYFYHVFNRASGRLKLFRKRGEFEAFEAILGEGQERFGMRICGYCLMANHWHLLLWPEEDGDLSEFMRWVTVTHTQRHHAARGTAGTGHVYQGRFKSFPVQGDKHYFSALRYIEANPVRAKLVKKAGEWEWSSYAFHAKMKGEDKPLTICKSPRRMPNGWAGVVRKTMLEAEVGAILNAMKRGCPLGDREWVEQAAADFELESTLKPRGRPKKGS